MILSADGKELETIPLLDTFLDSPYWLTLQFPPQSSPGQMPMPGGMPPGACIGGGGGT